MGWPPRTPPSLAECRVEANGECVMRSGAHQIGCPDTRPIKSRRDTSAEDAAAGAAAFAWAEASARAAPDTAGFARPDTATAAWAAGISHGGRQRIAHVGQGRVGYFQIRWTKERWVHRQLGSRILEHRHGRRPLRHFEFRGASLCRRFLRAVATAATAAGLVIAGRQL